jgi:hypothetical protein
MEMAEQILPSVALLERFPIPHEDVAAGMLQTAADLTQKLNRVFY